MPKFNLIHFLLLIKFSFIIVNTSSIQLETHTTETILTTTTNLSDFETTTPSTITLIAFLNDKIRLDCSIEYNKTSLNQTAHNIEINNSSNNNHKALNVNFLLFKKDNILIQLNKNHLNLIITNKSDQGVYECGSYYLNKYGHFNYYLNSKWYIQVLGKSIFKSNVLFNKFHR